nr:ankyrin repeat domain-containing protein [Stenotrophomonas pavanii]
MAHNASRRHAVQLMVDLGIDFNAKSKYESSGNTALHWLMKRGDFEGIQYLLEAGADPLLRNEDGKRAADMTYVVNSLRFGDEQEVRGAKALLESAVLKNTLQAELGDEGPVQKMGRKL